MGCPLIKPLIQELYSCCYKCRDTVSTISGRDRKRAVIEITKDFLDDKGHSSNIVKEQLTDEPLKEVKVDNVVEVKVVEVKVVRKSDSMPSLQNTKGCSSPETISPTEWYDVKDDLKSPN